VVEEDDAGENGDAPNGDAPKKEEVRTKVIITQVAADLKTFAAQHVDVGESLEKLLTEMREELNANPPLPGAYHPQKGDIVAAKYSLDGEWYRARIDKITGNAALVTFIDYGNQENATSKDIAPLPSSTFSVSSFPAAAKNYALAFVALPDDQELVDATRDFFQEAASERVLLLKSEYKELNSGLENVTLQDDSGKDIVLDLVSNGWFLINKERRRERRLQKTITDYRQAQDSAKKNRLNLWRYGDFTEDDAREFGFKA